ncbi:MAG: hypothetical protein AAB656_04565 [Patescibacteria group bacterium]
MMYKQVLLFKSGQILYHTQDLALLWGLQNRHNLRVTISRYIKKGLLYSVFKGLYSIIPVNKIDELKLGPALIHKFCYLSCQSILEKHGVINQKVFSLTFVSSLSKKIEFEGKLFIYKQMNPQFLLNPEGIVFEDGVYKASLERAVADIEYFNMNVFYDSPNLIDWDKVKKIKKKIGY